MRQLAKRISLLLCVVLLSVVFMPAALAEEDEDSLERRYIPCPDGGRHQMFAVASVRLYEGLRYICTAQAYQCSQCYLVIATQNLMAGWSFPGYAGHYSIVYMVEPIPSQVPTIDDGYMGFNSNINDDVLLSSCDWY